jgi:hypothetical protein
MAEPPLDGFLAPLGQTGEHQVFIALERVAKEVGGNGRKRLAAALGGKSQLLLQLASYLLPSTAIASRAARTPEA